MNSRFLKAISLLLLAATTVGCASSAERQEEREKKDKRAETHILLGSNYLQRGQLDIAKEELEKALGLAPDNSQVNNIMALLHWRLKEYDKADRHFRRAVDAGDNPEAWNNYGVFLCERDRLEEAERAFKKALADPLYKTPAAANLNAGLCRMRKPSPAAAEQYFREALRLEPKLSGALYQMAKLSFDSGQSLNARGFMERYFQTGEDTPESLWLAVRIERALGNKNAEASYALRLRGKFPDSPEAAQLQAAAGAKKK